MDNEDSLVNNVQDCWLGNASEMALFLSGVGGCQVHFYHCVCQSCVL